MTFDCGCATDPTCCGAPLLKPVLEVDFPVPEFEEEQVHALAVCSCACEEVTVSLSASCCFEKNSCGGSSVTARGDGTVGGSVGGGGTCCGPYTLLLNGSTPPIAVTHGMGVSASVVATGDGCGCCNTGCSMGEFPDCDPAASMSAFMASKAPIYVRVGNKLYLNEKSLINKLKSIKHREYFVMRKPKKNRNKIAPKLKEVKRRPRKS